MVDTDGLQPAAVGRLLGIAPAFSPSSPVHAVTTKSRHRATAFRTADMGRMMALPTSDVVRRLTYSDLARNPQVCIPWSVRASTYVDYRVPRMITWGVPRRVVLMMTSSCSQHLRGPLPEVWIALHSTDLLRNAIPGCTELTRLDSVDRGTSTLPPYASRWLPFAARSAAPAASSTRSPGVNRLCTCAAGVDAERSRRKSLSISASGRSALCSTWRWRPLSMA